MKRIIIVGVSLASVILLSACSTREDFVVANESDGVITVQFQHKTYSSEVPTKFVDTRPPAKLSIKEFQSSDRVWPNLSKGQYDFDDSTGIYTVKLSPKEALLVTYNYNHIGFDLESIKIAGTKGSISIEGRQVETQFSPESNGTYVIRYW